MNSNGNYYDNSYYAENCSLPLPEFVPLEYSEGTNSFGSSTTSSNHQSSFTIEYAYESGVPSEMTYGYQFAPTATEPLQMHQQQQYLPQNQQYQQIIWTQPQFPSAFDPNLHNENYAVNINSEMNKLAEGVASIKFGQKKAVKRKCPVPAVPMRNVKGGRYAIIAAESNKKKKRTEEQKKAQKETKANNKEIIETPEFQEKVNTIMSSLVGTELDKIKSNFMICSKYKEGRRKDPHKYLRNLIERILVKTMEKDREKLVKLFVQKNFVDHIWAVAKENKKAKLPRNKQFTMQINLFKKPYQIAEILIIMKRGFLMEPGELSRFTIIGNCKLEKEGRQCLNPWHYEVKYSAMDLFLFNKRVEWQQSFVGGNIGENEWKWDAEKEENASKLNSFGATGNEIENYSQCHESSSNCSSP